MVGDKAVKFEVEVALCVCDLPALASITNTVQYNGKFGCIKCTHRGIVQKTGKGHSRIYPITDALVSEKLFDN
jgi:hypothetical protein